MKMNCAHVSFAMSSYKLPPIVLRLVVSAFLPTIEAANGVEVGAVFRAMLQYLQFSPVGD